MFNKGLAFSAPLSDICLVCLGAGGLLLSSSVLADDSGDAPASYGQATHAIVQGSAFLGYVPPDDNTAVVDAGAQGDDNDGVDDEGGVFAFPVLVQNGKSYDTNVFATNPSATDATLVGWVDFDGNGVFDADEAATAVVPAGTDNQKFKLLWPDLSGVSSDYQGVTYARFRISSDPLGAADAQGAASDGEVEDYSLDILQDSDGDERPDITDPDNDNDGIPDAVEGTEADTDSDGTPNYLDVDSDADLIPDYVEAGADPRSPVDTDADGIPDYLDEDSDNDGTPDSQPVAGDSDHDGIPDSLEGNVDTDGDGVLDRDDLDSDNDTIPDTIEGGLQSGMARDTDGDGVPDFRDLDSDNDGLLDIREANAGELDVRVLDEDNNGSVDSQWITGANGLVDGAETEMDSGVPIYAVPDSDGDGVRDFRDLDSDGDGISDLREAGGSDADGDSVVDSAIDSDGDGVMNNGNLVQQNGTLPDVDDDGIPDFQDDDADGSTDQSGPEEPTPPAVDPGVKPDPVIKTGLSGGAGCSVGAVDADGARTDGLLMVLLCLAIVAAVRGRLRRHAAVSSPNRHFD